MSEKIEHAKLPWILGGCSGRLITTPDGYIGDGFIADVDTDANADYIIVAANNFQALLKCLNRLVADCAPYEAWQRPCLAYDEAASLLSRIDAEMNARKP